MASFKDTLTCGSCAFFNNRQIFGKPCKELGYLQYSSVCTSYIPAVAELRRKECGETNPVITLFNSIKQLNEVQAEVIAYLLVCQNKLKRHTCLEFLQPVFYRYCGRGNYINHYCQAYVLDCSKEDIRLINRTGTMILTVPMVSKIYTVSEFAEIKAKLVTTGNINDPKLVVQSVQTIEKLGKPTARVPRNVTAIVKASRSK